jgi:hypothetical protein
MDPKLKTVLILFAIFALLGLIYIILMKSHNKKVETIKNIINNLDNFNVTEYVLDHSTTMALALDKSSNTICFVDIYCLLQKTVTRFIHHTDLISTEIIKSGETVTKTSRSSQIGGAIVGGLAFGGVGAVVGGLSGKRKTSTKLHGVILEIIVNDKENPRFALMFDKNLPEAKRWHKMLTTLIKKAELEEVAGSKVGNAKTDQISVADEILKLADLKDKGLISEKDFEVQKDRILNSTSQ